MTRFKGGPADGKSVLIHRHPLFLRVTYCRDEWDALDLVEDSPRFTEQVFAYRWLSNDGSVHINRRVKGKPAGGFFPMATYEWIEKQPPEEVLRDNAKWSEWCHAQAQAEANQS